IMVVDLKYGITGGQNVSSGWANSNGKDENFRDTDILVQGPVVYQMAQRIIDLFVKDENGDFKNQSQMDVYRKLVSKKINESRAMGLSGARNYEKWFRENRQGLCRFVGQNPRLNSFEVLESYKHYVRHANNYIYAEIPQVDMLDKDDKIRTELLLDMLGAKKQRGVQIHILTNGNGFVDSTILPSSGPFNILKSMQESFGYNPLGKKTAISTAKALFDSVNMSGFNIYIYPHWTHGKIWNFDGIAASIGSFNFDSSATTWTESVLLCQDENLMSELIEEQQGLIRYSSKMETPNIVPKQKDLKK
ncbi:MAG: phosphatidylserine/phosphatidylglycerophosphate/cardiolipin synthase family protein, partial [Myxococcales bacterium]|nr:phosphatidylserine/phosphatidylglycerophosphate/cardiolipin synthase family protein [Myxococcales bacterium]